MDILIEVVVEHEVYLLEAKTNKPRVAKARLDLFPENKVRVCLWVSAGIHLYDGLAEVERSVMEMDPVIEEKGEEAEEEAEDGGWKKNG